MRRSSKQCQPALVAACAALVGISVNSVTNRVYASSSTEGTVTVINGGDNTIKATVAVGVGGINNVARRVAVNETTNRIGLPERRHGAQRVRRDRRLHRHAANQS